MPRRSGTFVTLFAAALMATGVGTPASAETPLVETPMLQARVDSGELPPVAERLPDEPAIVTLDAESGLLPGRHGGQMRLLFGRAKDVRLLVVYGYARLVAFNEKYDLVPDILRDIEVVDDRVFTLHLRRGHRWSDGHPFTAEDFRFFWEDVILNKEASPTGAPAALRAAGQEPTFEVIDELTVRFTWDVPNPHFLPALAGANPLFIYRPAHYLKQFHPRYRDAEELRSLVEAEGQRNWVALMLNKGRQYRTENPEMPSLQPWTIQTPPPAERFIFERNPYYHRVDENGRQLPYVDEVAITIASAKLIPAKAGSGEVDLQARSLSFSDYTFLKQGEKTNNFNVRLWQTAKGAHIALYPNLNTKDAVWRNLFREADFRRALSLGVNRHEINEVIYYGLALEANNTVLPASPLYREEYAKAWTTFDLERANAMLDGLGLDRRNDDGIRLLPDGRPMEIIIETAGEDTEQTDVLQLVHDSWHRLGIKIYPKPLQREVLRNRIFAGTTLMSVWSGLENGIPVPSMSPEELAPTSQQQLQWPRWGQFYESDGNAGLPIDMKIPRFLAQLNDEWTLATNDRKRREIWHDMLAIHADQVYTIGLICGVRQPVVVANDLRNVPEIGIYNWEPGAHFGIYRPDTFWFDRAAETAQATD
ncbi:MAG: ABC transporter substrate-binding protein [Rhodospirillales bacterium]